MERALKGLRFGTAIGFALCMSRPAFAADSCVAQPGAASTAAPIGDEAQRALLDRSLDIVRAAEKGDRSKLEAMVPSRAPFSIWHYDAGITLGSGPQGAVAFAKALTPAHFEAVMVPGGALAMTSICAKHELKVRFLPNGRDAYLVTFTWDRGNLVNVDANYAQVVDGKIGSN